MESENSKAKNFEFAMLCMYQSMAERNRFVA